MFVECINAVFFFPCNRIINDFRGNSHNNFKRNHIHTILVESLMLIFLASVFLGSPKGNIFQMSKMNIFSFLFDIDHRQYEYILFDNSGNVFSCIFIVVFDAIKSLFMKDHFRNNKFRLDSIKLIKKIGKFAISHAH